MKKSKQQIKAEKIWCKDIGVKPTEFMMDLAPVIAGWWKPLTKKQLKLRK